MHVGLLADLIIDQVLMRSIKTSGRLTRLPNRPKQRYLTYCLVVIGVCLSLAEAIMLLCCVILVKDISNIMKVLLTTQLYHIFMSGVPISYHMSSYIILMYFLCYLFSLCIICLSWLYLKEE